MLKPPVRRLLALALLTGPQLACSKSQEPATASAPSAVSVQSAALPPIDQQLIAERLGTTAQDLGGGAVAVTLARDGLPLIIDGTPRTGPLSTELVFRPAAAGAALAGSVELLEDEVSPVIDTLLAHGVRPVGLFSRFLYDTPRVLVLSFRGEGNPALLASGAQSIGAVLRDARLRSAQPLTALPGDAPERGKLDASALGGVLGAQASTRGDAVLIELPRPPQGTVPAASAPRPLLRASFAGSDVRAALDGTIVLLEQELTPVLAALRAANVHPVGIIPSAADADPAWYSLHFRGKGTSLGLVQALARALAARAPAPAMEPAAARAQASGAAGSKP